ncbi:MAG TPA: nucleotide exchange factor GrpE [Candidatus Polarisedimenticolia bacterium]|nr:nucleotide exchange factor GrpE [Candidatus Polarisedimenticolia bacterium]
MTEGKPVKVTIVDRRHHAAERPDGADGGERSPYPSFVEELKSRAEAAESKAREAAGRAEREIDAVRERLQRDVERRVAAGQARVLTSLVEVLDNLDRALAVASGTPAVAQGIDLVRRQLLGVLREEGIEPIETLGQEYDPNVAEAVAVEAVGPDRDNLVVEELQKGYRHREAVLRPARVKVGKAAVPASPAGS